MLPALFATFVIHWTNPSFQADTSDAHACDAGPDSVHLTRINLYRAWVGGDGYPIYLRSHLSPVAGAPDTAQVPDTPPATYFIRAENIKGEGCEKGITVGMLPVAVGPSVVPRRELYDLAGRKVTGTLRPGIYFERVLVKGKPVRRIVVIR